jgi:hypothetical protein
MKKPFKSKPVPVRDPLADAKFAYFSVCCNTVAKKTPCVAANKLTQAHLGAHPEAEGSLGSWRCSGCSKSCKCTRNVRNVEVTNEPAS